MKHLVLAVLLLSTAGCVVMSRDEKAAFERSDRRHEELKRKFWVSEWALDLNTNAMVYVYGQTGDRKREVHGGMGVAAKDTTLYIWPNRDTEQMCLSAYSESVMFWPAEYGVHFHRSYTQDVITVGSTLCVMKGYGPSAGKTLWIRVVPQP
ncbi:MAG TPA: hypothetical protein PLZ60_05380 [Kiritimatiellia bacterium]|jgi:hypothetical protein|nr:hypothetical protein [Kiritimatiellia bacterium]